MTERRKEAARKLDFEALRRAIELCEPETLLGFYADGAQVRILNGDEAQQQGPPYFELRGRAEIERYLHAVFCRDTTHRVQEVAVVGEERVEFVEASEYPDGSRIVVKTTLELGSEGEIARQVDVVIAREAQEGAVGGGVPGEEQAV